VQLTGPPKIGGTECPYPTSQRPLEAALQRDTDAETYVKARSGEIRRTSSRKYRPRFRFTWETLTYDKAHELLSAVSQHPVTVVPRTRSAGDPTTLPQLSFECRIVQKYTAVTPLYRRDPAGNRLARIELELEALRAISRPSAPLETEQPIPIKTEDGNIIFTW